VAVLRDVGGVVVQVGGDPKDEADVLVDDEAGLDAAAAAVRANPLASYALTGVLRATEALPVDEGLAVESLAYSMLLAGPEFARWLADRGPMDPPPTGDEPVLLAREGDVLTITLTRPRRHNAYAAALRDALVDALEVGALDPSMTVVVRGAGTSFCSGGDLAEFGTTPDVTTAHVIRTTRSAGRLLNALGGRLTIEVHGACIGAGTELAAFGRRVVVRGDAFFQLPEVAMGLIPGAGGTVSVTKRIGRHRTAWLALTGARIDVDTALAWGLVDERC
jgi:hypothetical protein